MVKAVSDFEEKMNDLRQNMKNGDPIDENFAISRKKELDSDLYDKVNFTDFEIFSFLMNLNSNGLRRIAELKTLHSNNQYFMIDTVFENAISVPILWIELTKIISPSDTRDWQRVIISSRGWFSLIYLLDFTHQRLLTPLDTFVQQCLTVKGV